MIQSIFSSPFCRAAGIGARLHNTPEPIPGSDPMPSPAPPPVGPDVVPPAIDDPPPLENPVPVREPPAPPPPAVADRQTRVSRH